MNIQHYILRVLLVFVCLFVLFSHSLTVCAADSTEEISTFFGTEYPIILQNPNISTLAYDVDGYTVNLYYRDMNGDAYYLTEQELDLTDPEVYYNGIEDGRIFLYYVISFPETISKNEVFDMTIDFTHSSGNAEKTHIAYNSVYFQDSNWNSLKHSYSDVKVVVGDTRTRISFYDMTCSNGAPKRMYIYFWYTPPEGVTTFSSAMSAINITKVSSNGLLSSIIDFVKKIWTGITELPSNIANSLKAFFDNIVNAVVNLGNTLLEGIKNLFIPSEEDITNMKDKWDTLLSDRFGALYQVTSLISDYASSFKEQSKNTITFPSISIPLAGATFEFGGWEVQVVPDGFGIIFDTLKMITSILATFLFINGLKNRFDKIMGGADDI